MGRIVHITGTDTGVGKTAVACALARLLVGRGASPGVCKPFSSGDATDRMPADARLLAEAAGSADPEQTVSPVRFRTPASPWAAAREEGRDSGLDRARRAVLDLDATHDILLVEGIGGVGVPLSEGLTYVDFMATLGGAVLVVARAGLGTLNHTLLTVEALRARRMEVAGVVLNRTGPGSDVSETLNPLAIETFGGVPVLADLPFRPEGPRDLTLPEGIPEAVACGLGRA